MSPAQPVGEPLAGPRALPREVAAPAPGGGARPFSVYLHVPYCRVRCGYCDFNTYTNLTMGRGASASDYVGTLATELYAARQAMDAAGLTARPASTVFVGGGTPTMLPARDLVSLLDLVRECLGLAPGAEVTTEANPDSVDQAYLEALAEGGYTRVSFGMQSAVPHVLAVLDRTHQPDRVPLVVGWARRAGLATSLDLIYGAPGESLEDWQRSLDAAVAMEPDHLSAYALVIEEGTRMWGQVRRGELSEPSPDDEATKYEMADAALAAAGYQWYEISSWARPGRECQHNLAYWRDWDWWGAGPGAHSHLGDVRLWNTKHPVAWAGQLAGGRLPVAGHEVIDAQARRLEQVMLGVRLREGLGLGLLGPGGLGLEDPEPGGLPRAGLEPGGLGPEEPGGLGPDGPELRGLGSGGPGPEAAVPGDPGPVPRHLVPVVGRLVADGLLDAPAARQGRAMLTLRGRLMADAVTMALTEGGVQGRS